MAIMYCKAIPALLGADNYCSIYEHRPSDCARFPYTDEDVILETPAAHDQEFHFLPKCILCAEKLLKQVYGRCD